MLRRLIFCTVLLTGLAAISGTAQEAPSGETTKSYSSYEELFDDFDDKRQVLLTRWDRLQERESVKPEDLEEVENDLRALDESYAAALERYVAGNPESGDVMPARYERTVALSRIESRLEDAVRAADEFLEHHGDSDLAGDVMFLKGQTLFQIDDREEDALAALTAFIEEHPDRRDTGAARMMKFRTLLFLGRVEGARDDLEELLERDEVREDDDAEAYLLRQRDNLDWIGREMPEFARPDVEGELVKKANLTGKPSLILFWDSTSGACLGELPFVQEAVKRFEGKMNFLGVSVNESEAAFEQWLDRNPDAVKFRNVWIDREEENSLVKKLDVTQIPFLVLVDTRGRIYRYDVRSDDMLRYAAKLASE